MLELAGHTRTHTHPHPHKHTHACTCTHSHTHAHTQINTQSERQRVCVRVCQIFTQFSTSRHKRQDSRSRTTFYTPIYSSLSLVSLSIKKPPHPPYTSFLFPLASSISPSPPFLLHLYFYPHRQYYARTLNVTHHFLLSNLCLVAAHVDVILVLRHTHTRTHTHPHTYTHSHSHTQVGAMGWLRLVGSFKL